MAELMEDHIRNHMPATSKSLEDADDDLIQIVRTYLRCVRRPHVAIRLLLRLILYWSIV